MGRSSTPMWGPPREIGVHDMLEFAATELETTDFATKAFLLGTPTEERDAWYEGHDEGVHSITDWLLNGTVVILQADYVRRVLIEDLVAAQANMDVCGDIEDHRAYEGEYYVFDKALRWLCGEPIGSWLPGVKPWVASGAVEPVVPQPGPTGSALDALLQDRAGALEESLRGRTD